MAVKPGAHPSLEAITPLACRRGGTSSFGPAMQVNVACFEVMAVALARKLARLRKTIPKCLDLP